MPVEPFQARVAQLALHAAAAHGFALAGGNALAAHDLLSRPTEDVDLFTPHAGGPGQVLEAVQTALVADGFHVQVVRSPAEHDGEFAQLRVSRYGRTTQLDLGRDWRAHDAVTLEVGLRVDEVALAMRRLDRLPDAPFGQYGLPPHEVTALRARFEDWPRDSALDDDARTAHSRTHPA